MLALDSKEIVDRAAVDTIQNVRKTKTAISRFY